jgi:hypothetical protein
MISTKSPKPILEFSHRLKLFSAFFSAFTRFESGPFIPRGGPAETCVATSKNEAVGFSFRATAEVGRVATWLFCAILRFTSLRSGVDNFPEASIVDATTSRNGVLVSVAIKTNFHSPIRTPVIDAGVRQTRSLVGVTSHGDPRRINAIFDHVAGDATGARR